MYSLRFDPDLYLCFWVVSPCRIGVSGVILVCIVCLVDLACFCSVIMCVVLQLGSPISLGKGVMLTVIEGVSLCGVWCSSDLGWFYYVG